MPTMLVNRFDDGSCAVAEPVRICGLVNIKRIPNVKTRIAAM